MSFSCSLAGHKGVSVDSMGTWVPHRRDDPGRTWRRCAALARRQALAKDVHQVGIRIPIYYVYLPSLEASLPGGHNSVISVIQSLLRNHISGESANTMYFTFTLTFTTTTRSTMIMIMTDRSKTCQCQSQKQKQKDPNKSRLHARTRTRTTDKISYSHLMGLLKLCGWGSEIDRALTLTRWPRHLSSRQRNISTASEFKAS